MYNSVTLIGRLGKEPEFKKTKSGQSFAKLSLATNEWRKDGDDFMEITQWHQVVIWDDKLAQKASQVAKGSVCYLEGMVKYRSYEQDGVTKYATDIEVPRFSGKFGVLDKNNSTNGPTAKPSVDDMVDIDDIPL